MGFNKITLKLAVVTFALIVLNACANKEKEDAGNSLKSQVFPFAMPDEKPA